MSIIMDDSTIELLYLVNRGIALEMAFLSRLQAEILSTSIL